jgi:hypothetical protein
MSTCKTFTCIDNSLAIVRKYNNQKPGEFYWTDRRTVHHGCRIYKCNQCGAKSSVLRGAKDLQRWWRKHKASTLK